MADETASKPEVQRSRSVLTHPVLVGIFGVALVAVGAVLALGRDGARDTTTVVAGADVPVTQAVHSLDAHNSPTIVQSPQDPNRLVIANKIDRPTFSAALHSSDDGGESWSQLEFPTPPNEDRPYAPDLAWGPDGTLYLSFVTLTGRGNNPEAAWLTTSDDGGDTWEPPRRVLGAWTFQLRLALDEESGDLYLTWLQAEDESVGTLSFVTTGLPIVAARSEDGGQSWSEPVRVSSPDRERVGAPSPAVGPDGNLYVLYYDFKGDRFDWENLEGDVYPGTFELVLARSDGERLEFTENVVVSGIRPYERFLVYLPEFPSLAVDPDSGDFYVAWPDARGEDADVLISRSEDAGATWSRPNPIHDQSEGDQYMPKLAVAPGGRVDAVFLDRRQHGGQEVVAAYFATSSDGARTWSNLVLSSEGFSAAVGPEGPETETLGRADQATRAALVSNDDRSFAAWTDAREGTAVTGRLDIYFARIRFSAE